MCATTHFFTTFWASPRRHFITTNIYSKSEYISVMLNFIVEKVRKIDYFSFIKQAQIVLILDVLCGETTFRRKHSINCSENI